MNRFTLVAALVAGSLPLTVGCATKKYVRNEVTPTVNKVNELDDLTAKNTHDIRDTDARAQQGIQQAKSAGGGRRSEGAGCRSGCRPGQSERQSGLASRDQPRRYGREPR